jgi:hypothetical protein
MQSQHKHKALKCLIIHWFLGLPLSLHFLTWEVCFEFRLAPNTFRWDSVPCKRGQGLQSGGHTWHSSLALLWIYCTHKSTSLKFIILQASHRIKQ